MESTGSNHYHLVLADLRVELDGIDQEIEQLEDRAQQLRNKEYILDRLGCVLLIAAILAFFLIPLYCARQ